ncbi:MAG: hypothetical protein ACT4RN_23760 [Pseudonocardia sp.]
MTRVALAVAVLGLVAAGCGAPAAAPGPAAPVAGAAAEPAAPGALDFTTTTVDGAAFDGAALAGTPALLWFWAPF